MLRAGQCAVAVEDQIVTLLKADAAVAAIVGTRVYDIPAPQGAPGPFITYQVIGAERVGRAYTGHGTHDVTRLQIDCYVDASVDSSQQSRKRQVVNLARAVRTALDRQGLDGEDTVDAILWTDWRDLNTPTETRRSLDFDLLVKDL